MLYLTMVLDAHTGRELTHYGYPTRREASVCARTLRAHYRESCRDDVRVVVMTEDERFIGEECDLRGL